MSDIAGVRFWRDSPSLYNLAGNRCGVCGKVFFPPRPLCTVCHRQSLGKMGDIRLRGTGEIFTFTVVHEPKKDFEMQVPYIFAIIAMDEGPRITGQIVDCETGQIAIGARVCAVFRKIGEEGKSGIIHYGYKFVLV